MTAKAAGLPHSDISGSKVLATSPERFAGKRVLHRLQMPRHPPIALNSFMYTSLKKSLLSLDLNYQKTALFLLKKKKGFYIFSLTFVVTSFS